MSHSPILKRLKQGTKHTLACAIILLPVLVLQPTTVFASAGDSCTASVSPSTINVGGSDVVTINVVNTSASHSLNYFRVVDADTRPSIVTWLSSPSGMNANASNGYFADWLGGSAPILATGSNIDLPIKVDQSAPTTYHFTVEGDSAGGSSPDYCSGTVTFDVISGSSVPASLGGADITNHDIELISLVIALFIGYKFIMVFRFNRHD